MSNALNSIFKARSIAIIGASGAGKSTLLRCLNGLVPHFSGGRLTGQVKVACHNPVSIKSLLRDFNSITEKALTTFLDDLENNKLLFRDVDKYLALAEKRPVSS